MVCRDFILPEFCKPCLFLSTFQFAKFILPYPGRADCLESKYSLMRFSSCIREYFVSYLMEQILFCPTIACLCKCSNDGSRAVRRAKYFLQKVEYAVTPGLPLMNTGTVIDFHACHTVLYCFLISKFQIPVARSSSCSPTEQNRRSKLSFIFSASNRRGR